MGPKKDPKKEVVEPPPEQQPPPIPPHELEGYGKFQYIDGTIYEGRWRLVNGKKTKHGQGILKISGNPHTNLGAETYQGNWQEDKMSGYGVYKYANGATYKGQWKNNKHHGKGQYQFPNGTLYEGQWQNHLMHGTGYYIDTQGRKWEGEYRDGKFQSKMQKQLIKQRQIVLKKTQLAKQVQKVISDMLQALAKSDKKTLKQNFSPFFPTGEQIKQQIKDPSTKFDQRPQQKWTQVLNILKAGKISTLTSQAQAQAIPSQRILKQQMQGPGQVVEILNIKDERVTKAAFVNVEGNNWILCYFSDEEKKK